MSAQPQLTVASHSPNEAECRALLQRVLASPEFRRAPTLQAFLTYVVDKKLAGRSNEISEVILGHQVFGRAKDYNPGEDSIVRTQARSVRSRLERYFATEGASESLLIEIPRGGYVPVFRRRPPVHLEIVPTAPKILARPGYQPSLLIPTRRQLLALGAAAIAGVSGYWVVPGLRSRLSAARPAGSRGIGRIQLSASDARLETVFHSAKERALACVYTGDRVGDWYASSLRVQSFCMRDVSHESLGAAALGLAGYTLNMLRRFAASIAKSRRWCGYWTISKDGFASPETYNNDRDFGYCLPANFDLLRACYRQLLWTGDRAYLEPVFSAFYDRTITSYSAAWDKEQTGWLHVTALGTRVHASYNQRPPQFRTSGDLVAAHYAALLAYAGFQDLRGGPGSLSRRIAAASRAQAAALRSRYTNDWWNPSANRFYSGILADGRFSPDYVDQSTIYPLWFGLPDHSHAAISLDDVECHRPQYDSTYSYVPEVLFQYGRNSSAYARLLEIGDNRFSGHALTETAFALVGAVATGLMGIEPEIPFGRIATLPRLTPELRHARLSHIPTGDNEIVVEHRGNRETLFTNSAGPAILWKVRFGIPDSNVTHRIIVDGSPIQTQIDNLPGAHRCISGAVPVRPGQTRNALLAS